MRQQSSHPRGLHRRQVRRARARRVRRGRTRLIGPELVGVGVPPRSPARWTYSGRAWSRTLMDQQPADRAWHLCARWPRARTPGLHLSSEGGLIVDGDLQRDLRRSRRPHVLTLRHGRLPTEEAHAVVTAAGRAAWTASRRAAPEPGGRCPLSKRGSRACASASRRASRRPAYPHRIALVGRAGRRMSLTLGRQVAGEQRLPDGARHDLRIASMTEPSRPRRS